MSVLLTTARRGLISQAAELGSVFATRADQYDREASFPYENFHDLQEAGFLALCIPKSYGGIGADFVDYALVSEELARYCGSTALTFNMHTATMLLTGQIADDLDMSDSQRVDHEQRRASLYKGVIEKGHIHAQPFSEGHQAGATAGVTTQAVAVDGGWRVRGRKIFASLSESAHRHNVTCKVDGEEAIRFLGIPADSIGITIEGEWDPLGMRGTISKNLVFDDVFVPAENEYLPPGCFDQAAKRWPYFFMTLCFTYLGIQRAVLDFTSEYLRGGNTAEERREHPQKQHGWAEMRIAHEQSQALVYRVLSEVGVDPAPAQIHRAWAAVVSAMETAPNLASTAVRVCGGRSLLRPLVLERLYRDARCGATMLPWSVEVCFDRLGRADLFDDSEAPV
tara:strand:+ start:313 stop:1497 length:1185 start_codon:yes stop_codon:yes gene_type:complete